MGLLVPLPPPLSEEARSRLASLLRKGELPEKACAYCGTLTRMMSRCESCGAPFRVEAPRSPFIDRRQG